MPEVSTITLVDRDVFEDRNVGAQDITPADVGRPKVDALAERLHAIRPELDVRAYHADLEDLPLSIIRSDVILAGLDSRRARQVLNEKAWQLGIPLVDGGVDGPGLLARSSVYHPGADRACLQCGWQEADYEAVEQVYPCAGGENGRTDGPRDGVGTLPTGAPPALGALAASLVALDCQRVLRGEHPDGAGGEDATGGATGTHTNGHASGTADNNSDKRAGATESNDDNDEPRAREILVEARHGNLYVTRPTYDLNCRMPEHHYRPVIAMATRTLDSRLGDVVGTDPAAGLRVLGQRFTTALTCAQCGERRDFIRLRVSMRRYWCWRCHGEMTATGFDARDTLDGDTITARMRDWSLESLGIRGGDVLEAGAPVDTQRIVVGGEYTPPGQEEPLFAEA
jgi:hypothetical protein